MATIVMESSKVIDAANKVISMIMARREKEDNETIARRMAIKTFSFKRGFYNMTREEAIKYIKGCGFMDSWGFSIYAYGTLYDAKRLLKLAQHGDPVTLNQDDIAVLF